MHTELYGSKLYVNVGIAPASFADGKHEGQLSTDDATPPNLYKWMNGQWVHTGSGGAQLVRDSIRTIPKAVERRFARTDNTGTSRARLGDATPTVADGSDLILYNGFTGNPKKILFTSENTGKGDTGSEYAFLGWLCVVNAATAAAAATIINNAVGAGCPVVITTATVQDSTTDHSGLFFVRSEVESYLHTQDTVIESMYMIPIANSVSTVTGNMFVQLDFFA